MKLKGGGGTGENSAYRSRNPWSKTITLYSKSNRNNEHLSSQIDLLCEMLTSLLIMGIQMGKMSELGWLIKSIEQAICATSLYFLYLLWLSISKILASSIYLLYTGIFGVASVHASPLRSQEQNCYVPLRADDRLEMPFQLPHSKRP
jgi:hypothetical protein